MRVVVCAAVFAILSLQPEIADAHANLERADPSPAAQLAQAPRQLRLTFGEPLENRFTRVRVLDTSRQSIDRGDSRVAPDDPRTLLVSVNENTPDGLYTVAWRTVSAIDGHSASGAYPLLVGSPPQPTQAVLSEPTNEARFAPETAIARWWLYLTAGAAFGLLVTWRLVLSPILKHLPAARAAAVRRTTRTVRVSLSLLLLGTLYAAIAQAASATDLPVWDTLGTPLQSVLGQGRFAVVWWPRLAFVLLALGIVAWRGTERLSGDLVLAFLACVLLTSSITSHAAALASGAYLAVVVDWVHLLGVAIWIGGLLSLVLVLPWAPGGRPRSGHQIVARVIRRFTPLGLTALLVLAMSGLFQAWVQVGSWQALTETGYGLTLLAKLGLVAIMFGLAAFNGLALGPRLSAASARASAAVGPLGDRFRRSARFELLVGLLALALAAVLTGLTPAREEIARRATIELRPGPVDRRITAQALEARVRIVPAVVGQNHFALELPAIDPSQVERVQLTMSFLDAELGSQPLVLSREEASTTPTWSADAPLLSQPGRWQAELLVRRVGQDDARSAVRFMVTQPGAAGPAGAVAAYPLLPSPLVSLAYTLVGAGLLVTIGSIFRGGKRMRQNRTAVLGAGIMLLAFGGYVYAQEQRSGVPLDVAGVRNPVTPDARSLIAGEQLYESRCATCHGDSGRGDGQTGLRLVPRPADLRVHMAAGHTDGQLFYWLSFGMPGTAMPAWSGELTEQERWDVINYIRAFATSAGPAR